MEESIDNNTLHDIKKEEKTPIIKKKYQEEQNSIKNNLITSCPFCKSIDLKFQEKSTSIIHLDIRAIVFSMSTIFQRKKQVLKCNQCNLEIKSDRILSELRNLN